MTIIEWTPEREMAAQRFGVEPHAHTLADPVTRLAFATAGRAVFTALNPETGKRYTYKVRGKKSGEGFSVYVLAGPDNELDYEYIGVIYPKFRDRFSPSAYDRESVLTFHPRKHSPGAASIFAFEWIWKRIAAGRDIAPAVLYHEGRCGRCGRVLTVPESVTSGIGPECAKKGKL